MKRIIIGILTLALIILPLGCGKTIEEVEVIKEVEVVKEVEVEVSKEVIVEAPTGISQEDYSKVIDELEIANAHYDKVVEELNDSKAEIRSLVSDLDAMAALVLNAFIALSEQEKGLVTLEPAPEEEESSQEPVIEEVIDEEPVIDEGPVIEEVIEEEPVEELYLCPYCDDGAKYTRRELVRHIIDEHPGEVKSIDITWE